MTIHTVTHNTLAHLRAVLHARRALAWSHVMAVSLVSPAPAPACRVVRGRAY